MSLQGMGESKKQFLNQTALSDDWISNRGVIQFACNVSEKAAAGRRLNTTGDIFAFCKSMLNVKHVLLYPPIYQVCELVSFFR